MPNRLVAYKANVFQSLAHPTRIAVVEILHHDESPPAPCGKDPAWSRVLNRKEGAMDPKASR